MQRVALVDVGPEDAELLGVDPRRRTGSSATAAWARAKIFNAFSAYLAVTSCGLHLSHI
jgi:hypothetical protein